jgi:transglutaminase-like putative cysteine protease
MKLHITHVTRYHYTPAVGTALHVATLQPERSAAQSLLEHQLQVEPQPAQITQNRDAYGNTRSFFTYTEAHTSLQVTATSSVETSAPLALDATSSTLGWQAIRERFRFRAGARYETATEFVFASPFAAPHDDFLTYALPSFPPGAAFLTATEDLMHRIYGEFDYEPHATEIDTPARQALQQRQGVCQDFAHIMIACLRSLGLPARYVSGYLLTHPAPGQPRLVGSDASHAWVSVYVPIGDAASDDESAGYWVDFDPTNNRWGRGSPGEDYVRLACGRDYGDISPLRGVIYGGAKHTLAVAVTVRPY